LKCVELCGEYFLLEGSHRAVAAVELGKKIKLEVLDYEEIYEKDINEFESEMNGTTVGDFIMGSLNRFPMIKVDEENIEAE